VLLGKKGTLPATWEAADIETGKLYSQEMCMRFPELKLCDLDWKVEQIATNNYPFWHYMWDSKSIHQDIKMEQGGSHVPESGSQMKCCGKSMTVNSKWTKVKDIDDASIKQGVEMTAMTYLTPAHLDVGDALVS